MESIIPVIFVLSLPFVALLGAIISRIMKLHGQQRLLELTQRERIAAIERGVPPEKLPPLVGVSEGKPTQLTFAQSRLQYSQSLTVGGLISLGIGVGIAAFLSRVPDAAQNGAWALGFVPAGVGIGLLVSGLFVRPSKADLERDL